ncbi:putative S-adenosylmethionine-dependent methyltransferase/MSMEI_2290 [Planctomycetaceae bacterium]|nr:putative S-adenosylmethionine-dependent methyltransferase/MSMEI_2290 [Planctomycetaceae bacterium]
MPCRKLSDPGPLRGPAIDGGLGLSAVTCNLCGKDDYDIVFEKGVAQRSRIVRCRHCSLMYSNPREADVDCVEIAQYDPEHVLDAIMNRSKWRLEKEALQVRDYESTRRYLAELFPQRGRLVEIGSGLGYLLDFFRKDGWTALGVEPNEGLCRYARQILGVDARGGTIEQARLDADFADVVTMIHVIEHVPDPAAVFREVFRVLRPGGCFVVETPRYDTLMLKLLGKRERSLSCNGHIYFFTSETLKQMAAAAGFKLLRHECVGRSMTLDRLLYNIGVISKSKAVQKAVYDTSRQLRLSRFSLTVNVRDMQRIYLHKPQEVVQEPRPAADADDTAEATTGAQADALHPVY